MIPAPTKLLDCDCARTALACLRNGLLDQTPERLECDEVSPETMPEICRRLLVHHDHMTRVLQVHFGAPVDLRILRQFRQRDRYVREILLTPRGSDKVVEYGIVRLDLGVTPDAVRDKILSGTTPLGEILINHNVLRRIEPKWYLRFPAHTPLAGHFRGGPPVTLFGRLGVIHCNGDPGIELLEVIPDVDS